MEKVQRLDVCGYILFLKVRFDNTFLKSVCLRYSPSPQRWVPYTKLVLDDPNIWLVYYCNKTGNIPGMSGIAQFQAKETTEIPDDIYNEILVEIKKERVKNMAKITPEKMRTILRKIKRNDYYEHIPYIINQLNGLPPPIISSEVEEIIRNMFREIQEPFEILREKLFPTRKNFLSYNYVMYKFFELLELDEYLTCFQLLKSRNKLHQQDIIWKHICAHLNWQFICSI